MITVQCSTTVFITISKSSLNAVPQGHLLNQCSLLHGLFLLNVIFNGVNGEERIGTYRPEDVFNVLKFYMGLMVKQYGGQENLLDSPKNGNGRKIVRPLDKSPYLEIVLFSIPEQIFWVLKNIFFSTPNTSLN